jgi:hypothetical protein
MGLMAGGFCRPHPQKGKTVSKSKWKKLDWQKFSYRHVGCIVKIDQDAGPCVEGEVAAVSSSYGNREVWFVGMTSPISLRELDEIWLCRRGPKPKPKPKAKYVEMAEEFYRVLQGYRDINIAKRDWSNMTDVQRGNWYKAAEAVDQMLKRRKAKSTKTVPAEKQYTMRCR